jgi:hypothetical protein
MTPSSRDFQRQFTGKDLACVCILTCNPIDLSGAFDHCSSVRKMDNPKQDDFLFPTACPTRFLDVQEWRNERRRKQRKWLEGQMEGKGRRRRKEARKRKGVGKKKKRKIKQGRDT